MAKPILIVKIDMQRMMYSPDFNSEDIRLSIQSRLDDYHVFVVPFTCEIEPVQFQVFYDNSKKVDGIYYANEHILRMMMYLELSRPRGEVERWKKVFTRLELLNTRFPIKSCAKKHFKTEVGLPIRKLLLEFIISHQRTLANIELEGIYKRSLKTKKLEYNLGKGGPFYFFSPDVEKDASDIKYLLEDGIKLVLHKEKGDYLSKRVKVYKNHILIAPFDAKTIDDLRPKLKDYKVNKKTIEVPSDWDVDEKLLLNVVKKSIENVK